jgi:hypothetical protein
MFKGMSRLTKIVFASCIVMLAILIGTSLAGNIYQAHLLSQSDARNDRLQQQNQSADNANQRLLRQYTNVFNQYKSTVGKAPVGSTPSEAADQSKATSVAGPQGPAGADATFGQVQQAVDAYCAILDRCVGPRGAGGPEGQVGAAGKNGANGKAGVNGAPGAAGANGKDGSTGATGPGGPAGKDSTVPGPKGDTGPAGPAGKDGAAGSDGRGVNNMTCDGAHFVVTYSDGTSQTTNASCTTGVPLP